MTLTDGDPRTPPWRTASSGGPGCGTGAEFSTTDAVTALVAIGGQYDIVYCDIDKTGYPAAFAAAAERVRVGGLYICDNVLWSGKVADEENDEAETEASGCTTRWSTATRGSYDDQPDEGRGDRGPEDRVAQRGL